MKHFYFGRSLLGKALALTFLVSCNPEEYYPLLETVDGIDRYCGFSKDVTTCQSLGERCQPAYLDLEVDTEEPVFTACIAKPDQNHDLDQGPIEDGISNETPDDWQVVEPETPEAPPSFTDAIITECQNLSPQLLYTKTVTQKKKVTVITRVKICHNSINNPHTILIPCTALKAHAKHHEEGDYLGACKIQ